MQNQLKLNKEALAVLDLMLVGCSLQSFGDYQNGEGETIGPRMDKLHDSLRAAMATTTARDTSARDAPLVDPVVERVREALLQRSQLGIKKYGDTLYNMNYSERAILQHAVEESMDLSNYLMARIMKIDADACTCPSGDGSLRWPCPAHPPESASESNALKHASPAGAMPADLSAASAGTPP